jgi:hypothetical protein
MERTGTSRSCIRRPLIKRCSGSWSLAGRRFRGRGSGLTPESTTYAEPSIDDYAERTRQTIAAWNGMNGQQGGDPAKLASALVQLAALAKLGQVRPRSGTPVNALLFMAAAGLGIIGVW